MQQNRDLEMTSIMIYVTKNPKETQELAGFLLGKFIKDPSSGRKKALVIALEGELGAGKTVFARGLAQALKVKGKIKSPTFNLIKKYPIPGKQKVKGYLYHLDCYRLKDHKDLELLGIKDILSDPNDIVLIEWSERVKKILPKKHIKVHIDHISDKERKFTIK